MNNCSFIGRLTRDIEVRTTQNGTSVGNFTLAVSRRFQQDGQPTADFLNFVVWGKTAEIMAKFLAKGDQVGIVARVQTRNWENQEGNKVYVTEFVVESFYFVGNKKSDEAQMHTSNDEDLPDW